MVRTCSPKELEVIIKATYKQKDLLTNRKFPLIVYGTFGIGKSWIVKDVAKNISEKKGKVFIDWNTATAEDKSKIIANPENYFVLLDIRLSEYDTSDLKGLPDFKDDDSIIWKSPYFSKLLTNPKSDGILFFDEINLATPLVISSVYKIIYDRIINENKISDNWLIMGCGNKDDDKAFTHELASPVRDRANEIELSPPTSEEWCCYDDKTEILTENGWKFFKDLKDTEKVFTLNLKNKKWEIQNGIKREYDFKGNMIQINNKSGIDLVITPNHRCLIENKNKNKFDIVNAQDLPSRFHIPKNMGKFKGKKYHSFLFNSNFYSRYDINTKEMKKIKIPEKKIRIKDFIEFLGYFLSEGYVSQKDYNITLSQKENKTKQKMRDVLNRMNIDFYESGEFNIGFNSKQINNYLRQFGTQEKRYIPEWIKNINEENLKILLNSLMKGDGNIVKNKNSVYLRYTTISKQLANDVQEIGLKLGYFTDILFEKNRYGMVYRVGLKDNKRLTEIRKERKHIENKFYKGKVYCVTTKNGIVMVRRNGKSCWCGNSWGINNGIDGRIIGFLNWKPSYLHPTVDYEDKQKFTTPRGWHRVSEMIKGVTDYDTLGLLSSIAISEGIANEFVSFCKIKEAVKLDEIIKNPELLRSITEVGFLYFIVSSLAEQYKTKKEVTFEKIMKISEVLDDMKRQEFVGMLWRLCVKYNALKFSKEFTEKDINNPLKKKYHSYIVD